MGKSPPHPPRCLSSEGDPSSAREHGPEVYVSLPSFIITLPSVVHCILSFSNGNRPNFPEGTKYGPLPQLLPGNGQAFLSYFPRDLGGERGDLGCSLGLPRAFFH